MTDFFQFLLSGLTVGSIYALIAIGFTLIYSASDVVNFAQGEFVMLGGLISVFALMAGASMPLVFLLAVSIAVVVGVTLHRFAIEPMKSTDPITITMMTIGASIALRGLGPLVFDKQFHAMPPLSGDAPISVGGVIILPQSLWVMFSVSIIVAILFLFLSRSVTGKAIRASAASRVASQLVGINVTRTVTFSFAISAALGALAGILITPITLMSYDSGTLLAVKGFAAAILGGIGFPPGAIVGGLLLGVVEALSAGYLSSAYKDGFAFIALLAILFFMPDGILVRAYRGRV